MFATIKKAALLLLACLPAYAADIVVNTFGGLNSFDPAAAIQPFESQDLLNINIQPGMKSVFKRDGYGLFQTLGFSTAPIHGGYHFQQTGGADVQLWGQATKLVGIINDAASVVVATGTDTATWQCADNLGFAYCLDSSNDTPVKTDGSIANTTYQEGNIPKGTMITSSPSRLIVAGVAGSLSTLNFSASNNFTSFTVGPLNTDPFTVIINASGSRLTHIAYYFGKLFWWKDQSFGFVTFTNQYDYVVTTVSNQIGTLDNSSAFWNGSNLSGQVNNPGNLEGGIYFRGQDNHIYLFDGYQLTRLTRQITPTIATAGRKKANSWTQTTQSDFSAGLTTPPINISTTIVVGDINVGSFTVTENSSASGWGSGTSSNFAVGTSSISLLTNNSGTATNPSFESALSGNWTATGNASFLFARTASQGTGTCTISPIDGSWFASGAVGLTGFAYDFAVTDVNNTVLQTATLTNNNDCTMRQSSLSPSASNIGRRVKFRFHMFSSDGPGDEYLTTSDSYIWGGAVTFYYAAKTGGSNTFVAFDLVAGGSSTITSGFFTSQVFDTSFTSSTAQISGFNWTANTSTPTFGLQHSASSGGPFVSVLTSSSTNAVVNRYVRYSSTITVGSADSALTSITSVSILARSTGTFVSAVNNAPSLTSWGTLTETDSTVGNSTITYYVRASSGQFTVNSSTPAWTLQTKNSIPTYSTGTYMQLRADFGVTAATENPSIQDFTFNWNEGNAADKSYITYFQDAIWVSVSSGTGGTNNRIFYLDLLNNYQWLLYDITANGFAIENNSLYFGDPTAGRLFKFGGVSTDNGASITSYWKSKDFTGADPTVQNEFMQADFIFNQAASTATYTYTLDQSTVTAVSIPLTSVGGTILRRGFLLPRGKLGFYYNFKIGDASSNPKWTLLMHKINYNALNWIPKTAN